MKLNKIGIKDFKKIKDLKVEFTGKPLIVTGANGSGKTSFIEAVRYSLTGESPLNPIRKGADKTVITTIANDAVEFEREISRPNKKSVVLMGKKTTNTAAKLAMEDVLDMKTKETDIMVSSSVLKSLKPDELGAIFYKHDHREISVDDIVKIMENSEDGTKKKAVMIKGSDKLPADVDRAVRKLFDTPKVSLDIIKKAYGDAKSFKSQHAAENKVLSVKAKDFEGMVRPEYDPEELKKKLEEIIGVEKNAAMGKDMMKTYNNAVKNKENQDKLLIKLKMEAASITAAKPDPDAEKKIADTLKDLRQRLSEQTVIKNTLERSMADIKRTLEALDKPVCPISKKLICTTDKLPAKQELQKNLEDTEKSLEITARNTEEIKNLIDEAEKKNKKIIADKYEYKRKESIRKQIEEIEKNPVKVPEKPEEVRGVHDYAKEKAEINDILAKIRAFDEAEADNKAALIAKRKEKVYDYIMEVLEDKGPVVTEFLKATAKVLEDKVKERSEILDGCVDVRFDVKDGLKPYFKFDEEDSYQSYWSLSMGQKIIATMLLTDLLNYYCGSGILILDELNDLDEDNFRRVMKFITSEEVRCDYENIIACMVNNKTLLDELNDFDVDVLRL